MCWGEMRERYTGPMRREHDMVITLLTDRIDAVANAASAANSDTLTRLDEHIRQCSATQRWLLRAMIGLCGWVIVHSPEILGLGGKIFAGLEK